MTPTSRNIGASLLGGGLLGSQLGSNPAFASATGLGAGASSGLGALLALL
jgi:hypothetical protein